MTPNWNTLLSAQTLTLTDADGLETELYKAGVFDELDALLAGMPVPTAEQQAGIDAELAHMEAHPWTDAEYAAALAALPPFVWEV